jgi:tRNA (guanine-N7-)-methyltransferase
MYGLNLHEDLADTSDSGNPELQIKTHYESLDIAGSNTIHYLSFSLPAELPNLDEELKNTLVHEQA